MNVTLRSKMNSNGSLLARNRPCAFAVRTSNNVVALARHRCREKKKTRQRVTCNASRSVSSRDCNLSNCRDGQEREELSGKVKYEKEAGVAKSNIVGVSRPILDDIDVNRTGGHDHHANKQQEMENSKELERVGDSSRGIVLLKILGTKTIFSWALSLWRVLPYAFRTWVTNRLHLGNMEWPPMYSRRHVMLLLSNFLSAKSKADRPKLNTVGLDQCGRSISAFNALENWRLEELIGMGIRDTELFKCALTHPAAVKPSMRFKSYERLEYLGDAVLELAIRDILLERIPEADEGILTFQCQALTKGDCIRLCGAWLGLDKWILTNVFSMKKSLLQSPSVLGDAFEALVGAIYKDKGLSAAKEFLTRVFSQCPFTDFDRLTLESNYHAELSRKLCSLGYAVPIYLTLDARQQPAFLNGPAAILYTEQVYANGRLHGIGRAYDQRIAQQFAAKNTLQTTMRLL
eukprot:jgi/Picsp_1/2061/NSC_05526-R1_ribonuclease iii